ncbi:MAG: Rieske 2Fe-2S domain-containing protein [Paracoccaceae bacterium]
MSLLHPLSEQNWGSEATRPPVMPDNWYMLARARDLKAGRILSCALGAHEIVLTRSKTTLQITAFAAHCAHMGCHLRHATACEGGIRCALHHRKIAADGHFITPDGHKSNSLVQPTYPTAEHYGMVFAYLGTGPAPALPLPRLLDGETYTARPAGSFETDTDWASLTANGFDMEHLATVHHRRLIEDATVSCPAPDAFRLSYRSRVTGKRLSDRLIKALSGNEVHATMTSWRGSMMFVESQLGPRRSFFLLSLVPRPQGGTTVHCVVGILHRRKTRLDALRLWATARMFRKFLSDDFQILSGLRWHPPRHIHATPDAYSQRLGHFFANLPQSEPPQ